MSQGGNKLFRINSRYDWVMFNHSLVLGDRKWAEKLFDRLGLERDKMGLERDKMGLEQGRLRPVLHKSVREIQQVLQGQRGLGIQGSLVYLESRRDQQGLEDQLGLGHLDNQVSLVYLEVQRGREVLLDQQVLGHRGIQERRVYRWGQQGLDHQGNQESRLGREDHLCLVYLVDLGHLKNENLH